MHCSAVLASSRNAACASSGNPANSAPHAPASAPTRLYRANIDVRRRASARRASTACSSGRNTLTSPLDGLSVPTAAISSSGQKSLAIAKAKPVAAMSTVAASSRLR